MGYQKDKKYEEDEYNPVDPLEALTTIGSGTLSGIMAGSSAGLPGMIIGGLGGAGAAGLGLSLESKQQREALEADAELRRKLDSSEFMSRRMSEVGAANAAQRRAAQIEAEAAAERAGMIGGSASQYATDVRQDIAEAQQAAIPAIANQTMQDALARKQAILSEEMVAQNLLDQRSQSDALEQLGAIAQQVPVAFQNRQQQIEELEGLARDTNLKSQEEYIEGQKDFGELASDIEGDLGINWMSKSVSMMPDEVAPSADIEIATADDIIRRTEELAALAGIETAGSTTAPTQAAPEPVESQQLPLGTPEFGALPGESNMPLGEPTVESEWGLPGTQVGFDYVAEQAVASQSAEDTVAAFRTIYPYEQIGGQTWMEFISRLESVDPALADKVYMYGQFGG